MKRDSIRIGDREIKFETGAIARQADGAVIVRYRDTVVLVTAVAQDEPREDAGFFPLTVDYRERVSSAGRFPGGFVKRETRPKDHEVLYSRLIDRSIRPLFPKSFYCETQVMATVLSFDPDAEPGPLCILGAAAALSISKVPWSGPVGGVRLVQKQGKFVLLPTQSEREAADLDLIMSFGKAGLIMVEGIANQLPEEVLTEALQFSHQAMQPFFQLMEKWQRELDVVKREHRPPTPGDELVRAARESTAKDLEAAILTADKKQRRKNIDKVIAAATEQLTERFEEEAEFVPQTLDELLHSLMREYMVREKKRIDGRGFADIRPISGKVGWLPRCHGSSLFTRGETQAVVSCTLGTSSDEQVVEDLYGEVREKFFLHYNFPPFCVGEVRPLRGPGRREIGHGNLATRALANVLPSEIDFPYTIRLVSDITESNGSSSMASVCGGVLALMDAGVPIAEPVAGVAMGLIQEGEEVMILSDIMGDEDHLGEMDFKLAGTETGVTAIQVDNKIGSLSREILERAFTQARESRLSILKEMRKILKEPRREMSPFAPRVTTMKIRKERIRDLIGAGGKTIQELQDTYNLQIDIQSDTGQVFIYSTNLSDLEGARKRIDDVAGELEVGKIYRGTVVATKNFGAFVRVLAYTEGLIHISELAHERVNRVEDVLQEGDQVIVKVLGVDRQGKIRLSRKEALHADVSEIQN